MVVWLASELMFFAGLFAAYFTLRGSTTCGRPRTSSSRPSRPSLATVVLVASSGTMHLAVVAAHRGDRRASVRWLAITALMGAVFLVNQGYEYHEADFSIDTHAYGSIFYLMTGFHGLHVIGGLVFMGAVAVASPAGPGRPPTRPSRSAPTTGTSSTSSGSPCSPPSTCLR